MCLGELLFQELEKRKREDSRYSLRIFAKELGINRTTLSFVINKKRYPSKEHVLKIIEKLKIPETIADELLHIQPFKRPLVYETLSLEACENINNWYHHGILGLAELQKNQADPTWISLRLGISLIEAKNSLASLVDAGLIKIVSGHMKLTHSNVSTPTDVPSKHLRDYQKQNIELAKKSLEKDLLPLRDMTSITFALRTEDIAKIKESIRKYQRRLCKKFESKRGNDVYTLAMQLFPLTQGQK